VHGKNYIFERGKDSPGRRVHSACTSRVGAHIIINARMKERCSVRHLVWLLLVSCGPDVTIQSNHAARQVNLDKVDLTLNEDHDPYFDQWVTLFEEEFGVRVDVPIFFSTKIKGITGAVCSYSALGDRAIMVNPTLWVNPPDLYAGAHQVYREIIMFHELGHCILNIVKHREKFFIFHRSDDTTIYQSGSIMNAILDIEPDHYIEFRKYYLKELGS
jgi:hypothetical protein